MTTPTGPDLPPDALVELASAVVDDALTPAERLEAEASAEVRELAERFSAVRVRLGEPIPVDPSRRDTHLAAALAAFASDHESAHVVSFESARDHLARRRARRLAPVLAAAAALAAVGIVAGSLAGRGSDGTTVTADATAEVSAEASSLARSGEAPEVATSPETAADDRLDPMAAATSTGSGDAEAGTAPLLEGAVPTEIPALVAAALEERAAARQPTPEASCAKVRGEPIASITWNGAAALLTVAPSVDSPTEAFVIDSLTCSVIASATLGS